MKSILTRACGTPLALFAGLDEIELSDREISVLQSNSHGYVWQFRLSKAFLAWRRRLLCCASFLLAIEIVAILAQESGIMLGMGGTTNHSLLYTPLGLVVILGKQLEPFIVLPAALSAAMSWANYNRSSADLVVGWALGMSLVLWRNHIIPMMCYMQLETEKAVNPLPGAIIGATSVISVLPSYLALVSGLELGARRLYFFAPSPSTGAMIVLSAISSTIIPFASLALAVQLFGDVLLRVGSCLFVLGPTLVIMNYSRFTSSDGPFNSNESIQINNKRVLVAAGVIRIIGLCIIFLWTLVNLKEALYDNVSNALLIEEKEEGGGAVIIEALDHYTSRLGCIQLLSGLLGNMMLQAVFWADILLFIARSAHVKTQKLTTDLLGMSPRSAAVRPTTSTPNVTIFDV